MQQHTRYPKRKAERRGPKIENEGGERKSGHQTLIACLISGSICAVLLIAVLRLYEADFSLPLNYLGDAVVFLAKAKGILGGEWIYHNATLGAPFGADFRDFPLNITFDSCMIWIIGIFTRNPGLALNLYWLLAICATASLATYALVRLRVTSWIAATIGVIYAVQPYVFYRGISHLHSLFHWVPLIALGAIEVACGGLRGAGPSPRSLPRYLWIAAIGVGFSYQYSAFFSCFVLGVAVACALASRSRKAALAGLLVIALICLAALIDLSPSLVHWVKDGRNPSMAFKNPAEAEVYGLKLRFLLTPVPDHPFPVFRYVEQRLRAAAFPLDTENESARLGTVGAVGFVGLIGFLLYMAVRHEPAQIDAEHAERLWGVMGALCLCCVLLATVGGFGSLFNTFVLPDIRCYNRIVPFISFFSLAAVALALEQFRRKVSPSKWGRRSLMFGMGLLVLCAGLDQPVTSGYLPHSARQDLFRHDREFVQRIESGVTPDCMIFQLPYTDFPVENLRGKMFNNDQGRPYIHSQKCRWAWAAVSGTTPAEWNNEAAGLPIPRMLARLIHRGFTGIWVDNDGYTGTASPEEQLTREVQSGPLRSASGRYLFYDLRQYRDRLRAVEAGLPPDQVKSANPVELTFERGFYDPAGPASVRWSSRSGRVVLTNPLRIARRIRFSTVLSTGHFEPQAITVKAGSQRDEIPVARAHRYEKRIDIAPQGQVSIDFSCAGRPVRIPGDARNLCFALASTTISDE